MNRQTNIGQSYLIFLMRWVSLLIFSDLDGGKSPSNTVQQQLWSEIKTSKKFSLCFSIKDLNFQFPSLFDNSMRTFSSSDHKANQLGWNTTRNNLTRITSTDRFVSRSKYKIEIQLNLNPQSYIVFKLKRINMLFIADKSWIETSAFKRAHVEEWMLCGDQLSGQTWRSV